MLGAWLGMEVGEGDGGDETTLPFSDSEEEEKEREKAKIEEHLKCVFFRRGTLIHNLHMNATLYSEQSTFDVSGALGAQGDFLRSLTDVNWETIRR